ncbi:hypothetical protein EDC01DRAFT_669996 [Geopyxis carbonaria]|nr:hypothetical protein EDC01DRAFT_669996 [Geopyxis carbonaria]
MASDPQAPVGPDIDIMNDPAFAPGTAADGSSEPDHCRICRSEGSAEEPLYHPCKCSGSIKFVHQDCLMEWLTHSQKKYCELCKTQFTFTKVYDPDMPQTLPTPLFLRQAARHMLRNIIFWARGVLVGFVWLGCLPWCVGWMWRAWFWLGDGGWWARRDMLRAIPSGDMLASPTGEIAGETTAARGRGIIAYLASPALSVFMSPINGGSGVAKEAAIANTTGTMANTTNVQYYPDGIFFDSNPFHTMSRWPVLNRLVVDVIEGQLLTALIVVMFILVFLIREWVVQQQPGLGQNLGLNLDENAPLPVPPAAPAAPAEHEAGIGAEDNANPDVLPAGEDVADAALLDRAYGAVPDNDDDEGNPFEDEPAPVPTAPQQRVFARPRRRRAFGADQVAEANLNGSEDGNASGSDRAPNNAFVFGSGPPLPRPASTRENTAQATNLRRDLEEMATHHGSTSSYDFGPKEGSSDSLFQFGTGTSEPSRPSSVWSTRGTTEEQRDSRTRNKEFWAGMSDELETIDTGRTKEWRRASMGELSSPPGSPISPERRLSTSHPVSNSIDPNAEPSVIQDKEKDLPSRDENASWSSSEQPQDNKNKGKGKEVIVDPNDDDEALWEDSADGDESKTEGSHGVGASEWSTTAQAGDASLPPYSSPPSPPPFSIDVPVQPQGTDSPPNAEEDLQMMNIPEMPDATLAEAMRQVAVDQGIPEERLRAAWNQRNIDAQPAPALPQRQQNGLWNWFGNVDIPDAPADPANNDDDDDDEEDVDNEAGGQVDAEGNMLAAVNGNVPPAIVDEDAADDFEGIMELVGMRGPIMGLVQNAAISSMLITATVAIGVAFPYVTGKTVMMIIAHPVLFFFKLPALTASFCAEFIVDSVSLVSFSMLLLTDQTIRFFARPIIYLAPALAKYVTNHQLTEMLQRWASERQERVVSKFSSVETTYAALKKYPPSAVPPLGVVARESYDRLSKAIAYQLDKLGWAGILSTQISSGPAKFPIGGVNVTNPVAWASSSLHQTFSSVNFTRTVNEVTLNVNGTNLAMDDQLLPYTVYKWSAWDRVAVVILGYVFFTIVGTIYVKRRRGEQSNRNMERLVVDFLEQCGGVMKVVLIIGIEMFVFPLYCGILLDIAMLPLFETATIAGRVQFAIDCPLTTIFVHWFVGTCYMFHFALFVSMCRKIMRSGVLYFIRDPDDPTFHPVRDVLDRPVITQLRKIAFSGFIYGVLVLVCLGGVVWSLYGATVGVLPIHWSSSEPVLEFPVDLLFYNFLMPFAVKFFKPSEGLQKMYGWWFKRCARTLRLSSFMFGDRLKDEEGYHCHPTWQSWLMGEKGDVEAPVLPGQSAPKGKAYFQRSGRFVRAPASDSIRRARGTPVFMPVDEQNRRLDVSPAEDPPNGAAGANSLDWKLVYIPPYFRVRVGMVVLGIWFFAAFTGVAATIGPLLLGRAILGRLVPRSVHLNDIYAFSVGIYLVGGTILAISKVPAAKKFLVEKLGPVFTAARSASSISPSAIWNASRSAIVRVAKVSYVVTAFAVVMPTLVALMIEFYVIIPIHTAFGDDGSSSMVPTSTESTATAALPSPIPFRSTHTVHFVQDWTLGVLYVKMMGRMMLLDPESVWARALRGVVGRGWLDPDVKLATSLVAPAIFGMVVALTTPLLLARGAIAAGMEDEAKIYRFAFPAVMAAAAMCGAMYAVYRMVEGWKGKIKDEVYLRGVRVHNHGEKAPPPLPITGTSTATATAAAVAGA